ncbi:Flp pilus assembly complex ATPase component TadA [Nocardioidaceae bacterium]|nr:Flp pilus assembly complex ATPase component TadA [Nocardioidaceae bacterium]
MTAAPAPLVEVARAALASGDGDLTVRGVAAALRRTGEVHGDGTVLAVHDALALEVRGAGPLEPLLRLPGVTDVLVNGPDAVYVDRGRGLEPAQVRFADDAEVRRLAQRLAAGAGRRLDDAMPHADLRLRDGTRFHAVLAPVARGGTSISLRVPRRGATSLEDLVTAGSMDAGTAEILRAVVRRRLAFLVSGGTGSGKTTLLAALLGEVPDEERVVVVEDSAELDPPHPHLVALEARPANVEGSGEVTVRDLVRQSLRMRPDRVVVGEVRNPAGVSWRPSRKLQSSRETPAPCLVQSGNSLCCRSRPGINGLRASARPDGRHNRREGVHVALTLRLPWPPPERRPPTVRHDPDHPDLAHLPLVRSDEHGNVELLRGDPGDLDRLSTSQLGDLSHYYPNEPVLVALNRAGRARLVPVGRRVTLGDLEFFLATELYDPPPPVKDDWFAEEAAAEDARRRRVQLRDLEADGWLLTRNGSVEVLVDQQLPWVTGD